MLAGEGGAAGDESSGWALEDDPAAVVAGAGAEVVVLDSLLTGRAQNLAHLKGVGTRFGEKLAAAGITDIAPADGAFYVYAHVPHLTTGLGLDSLQLTSRWLHELGVAATSGIDFDLARGHEYVRFSYAGSRADLIEACDLLAAWTP